MFLPGKASCSSPNRNAVLRIHLLRLVLGCILLQALLEGNAAGLEFERKQATAKLGQPQKTSWLGHVTPQTSLSAVALTVAVLRQMTSTRQKLRTAFIERCRPGTVVQQRQPTKGAACRAHGFAGALCPQVWKSFAAKVATRLRLWCCT